MRLKADAAGIVLTVAPSGRWRSPPIPPLPAGSDQSHLERGEVHPARRPGRPVPAPRRGHSLDIVVADTASASVRTTCPTRTPFFQAGSGGYKRQHEGTGLGLSGGEGLVGLHGGALQVESAPQGRVPS